MNSKILNRFTLLMLTGLLFLLASCKKYLDQKPITEVGSEMVFSDVASTQQAIAGVYSRLVGDQGFGIRLSLYYTVDNDETQGLQVGAITIAEILHVIQLHQATHNLKNHLTNFSRV